MIVIAAALAVLLLTLASVHIYWGFGGVWPGHDEASCARSIAGFKGIDRMPPPIASFAVAGALTACAALAIALSGSRAPLMAQPLLATAGTAAALVFVGRGVAGFTPAWRRMTPEMPFARNDRRWFSPLCLAIGAAFAFLSFQGFTP